MATKKPATKKPKSSKGKGKPPSAQTEEESPFLKGLFEDQLQRAIEENESLKKENEELKKQNGPLKSLSSPTEENLSEKYNNLQKQYDDLKKRFAEKDGKCRNVEERAHKEIENLKKENEGLKKQSGTPKSEEHIQEGQKAEERNNEKETLQEKICQLEKLLKEKEELLKDDRQNQADKENEKLKKEIEEQQKRIKTLETENAELESDFEKRKEESKKEDKLKQVDQTQTNETLKTENKEQQKRIKLLETENTELKSDLEKRKEQSKKQKNQPPDDISALRQENESLKNRLSQLAGAKLTEGNPNIADLSDKNRPINLAEKFSELYDNEWTDALEEQMENGKKSEEEGIGLLLDIVKRAYEFSSTQANTFYNSMTEGMKSLGLPDEKEWPPGVSKEMKDHRKSIAVFVSGSISKKFLREENAFEKATSKYAETCASLCWFMCVQDPPVYVDPTMPKGNFNSDKYRGYTKTGNEYKYLVWPPLYLHKGGPMLGKGVAQGK
ncbi:putative golgin subfamily A member 6-like protein 3 isoform X2 [Ostrea edulis]|uniref:putative golgin subfamily A member 6-like protein 3 isoform X2 n=1 Tax=Ostrea edulis TaxID=37623 RepID=UPI0024AF1126|nr:putative golgin subfamily A member 6-like protein 3 isoform X2 [Ostrea edulis]